MADLHNLVVSFTASHSPGDEWHSQKIIFLLGCNKSYVKCSTAYIAMAGRKKKKKDTLLYFYSPSIFLFHFLIVLSFFSVGNSHKHEAFNNKGSKFF